MAIPKTKKPSTKEKQAPGPQDALAQRELEDQLKRALADYQNLERRVEEERKLLLSLSSAILIEKFLPVLDNLENAQKHLNDEGLSIVTKQFKDILAREGVVEIEAEGAQFDPHLHEATEVIEDPTAGSDEGRVVKVLRKGYKLNDKVLRPAQVAVERSSQQVSHPRESEDQVPESVGNDNLGDQNV